MTLRTNMLCVMSVGLLACAQTTNVRPCGDGESVAVNGASYCVYKEAIVIVGGFECPASMRFRMDFDTATVCGDHAFDNIDVPNDICARVFVPCAAPVLEPGGLDCEFPFEDCNGVATDGCETSLNTVSNCGACGNACGYPTPFCVEGACVEASADAGSLDPQCPEIRDELCDGLDNDCDGFVDNIASASDRCTTANGTSVCDFGACRLVTCNTGFGDCNAIDVDGCEASLNDINSCGACGVVCPVACASINGEFVCIDNID